MKTPKPPEELEDLKETLADWLDQTSFILECHASPEVVDECLEALSISLPEFHNITIKKHNLSPHIFNALLGFAQVKEVSEQIESGWLHDGDAITIRNMKILVQGASFSTSAFHGMSETIKGETAPYVLEALKFRSGRHKPKNKKSALYWLSDAEYPGLVKELGRPPRYSELIKAIEKYEDVIQEIDYEKEEIWWKNGKDEPTPFSNIRRILTALKKKYPIR